MPNWRKVITSGSDAALNTLNVSTALTSSGDFKLDGAFYDNNNTPGTSGQILFSTATGLEWGNNVAESSQDLVISGKNMEATTIPKGTPLYFSGSNTSGNIVGVYFADAGNPDRMPAGGIAAEQLTSGQEGSVYIYGFINGVDTSAFAAGDDVFVAVGGGYTNSKPTGSALIQKLGNVEKSALNGSGVIQGPSWYNDLPNWEEGKIMVGRSDGQPVTSSFVHLDEANGRVGIGTDSPNRTLDIAGDLNITHTSNIVALRIGGITALGRGLSTDGTRVNGGSTDGIEFTPANDANIKAVIRPNGYVGVNTTSPSSELDVYGTISLNGYDGLRYNAVSSSLYAGHLAGNDQEFSNAFGYRALDNNTGARSNGFGYYALRDNTGIYSNGFGFATLQSNTGGYSNGFGYRALENNTGDYSNGFGYQALYNNTGTQSNGFGYLALQNNTGIYSNGFGYATLYNNTGDFSNAFGYLALQNNSGSNNTAFGHGAGYESLYLTGSNNTFLGSNASYGTATNISNATAVGANVTLTDSNTVILGNNANVGIGTTSPDFKLDVIGSGRFTNGLTVTGSLTVSGSSTFTNYGPAHLLEGNVGIGTIESTGKLAISDSSYIDLLQLERQGINSVAFRVGNLGQEDVALDVRLPSVNSRMAVRGAMTVGAEYADSANTGINNGLAVQGSVGIGTPTPNYKLDVVGSGNFTGGLTVTGSIVHDGDLTVNGIVTAREFHTEFVSASIVYSSGSTKFGDTSDDVHQFTGSIKISSGDIDIPFGSSYGYRINSNRILSQTSGVFEFGALDYKTTYPNIAVQSDNTFRVLSNGSTLMLVSGSGRVGIGTTSPSQKLEVIGDDVSGPSITWKQTNRRSGYLYSDTAGVGIYDTAFNNAGIYLANNSRIDFRVNGSERMRIDSAGRLLISATSTSFGDKFYINNDAYTTGGWRVGTSATYVGKLFNSLGILSLEADGVRSISFANTTNGEIVRIDGVNSRVGIGTTTPSEKLEVVGNIKLNNSLLSNQENTDVDTGTETVATVATADYDAAFFDFVIKNSTNLRAGTVFAVHDGTNVEYVETSTQDLGDTTDVTLAVDISAGELRLRATTTSDNWTIKSLVRSL